jgi:LPPG:FO 2-phospho-L-lactate transferase
VITHALAVAVKRWNRNSYHSVTRIRRVVTSACPSHPPRRTTSRLHRLVSVNVKVTVLVGGVGGARFLLGVQHLLGLGRFSDGSQSDNDLTAIVNVGDDAWMYGVRICPDLDTCMYTLGDGIDSERGWGRRDETWHAKEELAAYGVQPDWFGLGDRDLATHLVRSQMLRAGYPLSQVTEALCDRWQPGARLLPASDDRSETHVVITDPGPGDQAGEKRAIHFEEWWVRYRAQVPTHSFAFVGADKATAGPGVTEAIETADVVLLAPSNPVVSIGAILAVPGIRGALRSTTARVIGYSPIIGGKPVRGMADECLSVLGVASTSDAVGGYYGPRSGVGILDGWLVHEGDHAEIDGVEVRSAPLLMTDPQATAEMVRAGLDLAGVKP